MFQTIIEIAILFTVIRTKGLADASCDIFFYNKVATRLFVETASSVLFLFKCPLPPVTITINVEEFCRDAKKHVDCVNRRLENCTEVQEYGPALGR